MYAIINYTDGKAIRTVKDRRSFIESLESCLFIFATKFESDRRNSYFFGYKKSNEVHIAVKAITSIDYYKELPEHFPKDFFKEG